MPDRDKPTPDKHKPRVMIDPDALREPETSGGLVGDDMLVGVPAISQYLYGKSDAATRRLVYGELNSGFWPGWKRGGRWSASKQALTDDYHRKRKLRGAKPTR